MTSLFKSAWNASKANNIFFFCVEWEDQKEKSGERRIDGLSLMSKLT